PSRNGAFPAAQFSCVARTTNSDRALSGSATTKSSLLECGPAMLKMRPGSPATWRAVPWTHIDVGKQWTRDAALRRAARVVFATAPAPFSVIAVPVLVGAFNHSLISRNHQTIHDATGRGFEEVVVRRCAGTLL